MTESLTGRRFGRLLVAADSDVGTKERRCECVCDCGARKSIFARSLTRGLTLSCGCLNREIVSQRSRKHGATGTPEYRCWHAMISRCRDVNNESFSNYGERGIKVCERWLSFENFLTDMGRRPSLRHQLDRFPNQSGNYEPGNVRWGTTKEQGNNRSNNVVLEFRGERRSLAAWSEELGFKYAALASRYRRGMRPPELFKPLVFSRGAHG